MTIEAIRLLSQEYYVHISLSTQYELKFVIKYYSKQSPLVFVRDHFNEDVSS